MSNALLTPDLIAAEALVQLQNELVVSKNVYRDLETMYESSPKPGSTVRIRRPVQFTVRTGNVAQIQNVDEGNTSLVVDKFRGVDWQFNSTDLTLDIEDFSDRYIKPAMIQLANQIDLDVMTELYKRTYNWVGTPGQLINSFSDFTLGPNRLDNGAVPKDNRKAILSPNDYWAMVGGFGNGANFFQPELAKTAIQRAKLPMLGNVDAFASQNVVTHVVGAHAGTPLVRGASQNVTYNSVMATPYMSQTLATDGWTGSQVLNAGDVFSIDGVYAVNPVSKAVLPYLQQFVIIDNVTTNANSANATDITIAPAIITSGPYQTVSAAPLNDAPINYVGTASTGYAQNLVYHRNACALAVVPLDLPVGAAYKGRQTKDGFSIRVVGDYDFTNDLNAWRFDVLYGVRTIDPRLSTRLSGSA
jgi:hypothetical protein